MLPPMRFVTNIRFSWNKEYCLCHRSNPYTQVIISRRLKEIIENRAWSRAHSEDLEEIRALYELGFLVAI